MLFIVYYPLNELTFTLLQQEVCMTEQYKSKQIDRQMLLSTSEVLRVLNIAKHKLDYLFESRKLKREDFTTLDNGHRIYRQSDLNKIRQVLFKVSR